MQTKLFDGVAPSTRDDKILAALNGKADPDGSQSGKPMNIALIGPTGTAYRAVRAWGLGEYMRLTSTLADLGLVNIAPDGFTAHGFTFDDAFAEPH